MVLALSIVCQYTVQVPDKEMWSTRLCVLAEIIYLHSFIGGTLSPEQVVECVTVFCHLRRTADQVPFWKTEEVREHILRLGEQALNAGMQHLNGVVTLRNELGLLRKE